MQNQASAADGGVGWYHPGEIVIVAHVRRGALNPEQVHGRLRERLGEQIPAVPTSLRTFVFDAPDEPMSLAFLVQKLSRADSAATVKQIVESLHGQLGELGTEDMEVLAAMPHYHLKAHESGFGGSPGSDPVPVPRGLVGDRPAHHYVPASSALRPDPSTGARAVRVGVLDTHWDFETTRRRAEHFQRTTNNQQLIETVERLRDSMHRLQDQDAEWREVGQYHTTPDGQTYHMPDHGLFVAGLIDAIAPEAQLRYVPVLDDNGVGDLSLLLLGLQHLLRDKAEGDPQIINLSLGVMPHPARLPAAWYGLRRPHDPQFVFSEALADNDHDARWVATNRLQVNQTVDLLQRGLRELARYLALNNCLVVAAVGNDSLVDGQSGRMRMQPRLPARFASVLGVAATTARPDEAAPYSNLADERALGDHVATFGGSITRHDQPENGVIGIYAGEFPDAKPNDTGWAYWSGTSFATAMVSGMAANLWAKRPRLKAHEVLGEVHAAALEAGHYVSELHAPSIAVEGRWRQTP